MPPRLPIPGSDDGTWGDILNEFLEVEHNANGTLKAAGSLALKANAADLTSHTGATAAHGATGAVVGTTNVQTLTNKTLTTPTISSTGFTNAQHAHTGATSGGQLTDAALSSAVTVAKGGTGRATSTTAYGLIAAGTTATGAQQTIAPGTAGQVLVSGGASALASFQAANPSLVGLGNVDNTSDANKPVSTATQTALNLKADAADLTAHTSDTANPHGVTKGQIGLSNVPNTDFTSAVNANTAKVTNATHTGEVTGSGALTIATGVVTNAKLADVATGTIKGRVTAATGDVEDLTATQVRTLLNVANGATANSADATLLARANHTGTQTASTISDFSAAVAATPSVTANTAKVTNATHTGDVTGSGALTIATSAVTNTKLANVATATMKGRVSASTGDVEDLTATQVRTLLNVANGATANSADATLLARANHTGTQTASTISDFSSAVSGNSDVAASTAHTSATAAHGATGAVVGTTNAQTLTNKTLTTPIISSTGFTNAQHAHTGATSGGQLAIEGSTTGTLSVSRGGTGRTTSTTANGLIAAGTTATGALQTLATGSAGQFLTSGGSSLPSWTNLTGMVQFYVDGLNSVIATGEKGDIVIPYDCTVTSWMFFADQSTTTRIELWKDTFANYPPVAGDNVTGTGTQRPGTTATTHAQSSTLTGWTTSWNAGDILRVNVAANDNAQKIHCVIHLNRTS